MPWLMSDTGDRTVLSWDGEGGDVEENSKGIGLNIGYACGIVSVGMNDDTGKGLYASVSICNMVVHKNKK